MKIHKKVKKKIWRILLTAFVLMFFQPKSPVQADKNFNDVIADMQLTNDSESGLDEHESDYSIKGENQKIGESGKWKTRNQRFFYYENGKKVTGLKEIQNKYYYFAANGIQRTGWQYVNGDYYFFKTGNGGKGWMQKAKTVNGIRLTENGKAELTETSTEKLNVLVRANQVLEKATRPEMGKAEKLQKCFEYLLQHFQYRGSPVFEKTKQWEADYALNLFEEGHGNCYAFGAAFAFLANAAGYKNCYAVSSGGHGWAEIAGKIYDPTWSLIDDENSYYGVSFDLSGRDGRPNYKNARKYVAKI